MDYMNIHVACFEPIYFNFIIEKHLYILFENEETETLICTTTTATTTTELKFVHACKVFFIVSFNVKSFERIMQFIAFR